MEASVECEGRSNRIVDNLYYSISPLQEICVLLNNWSQQTKCRKVFKAKNVLVFAASISYNLLSSAGSFSDQILQILDRNLRTELENERKYFCPRNRNVRRNKYRTCVQLPGGGKLLQNKIQNQTAYKMKKWREFIRQSTASVWVSRSDQIYYFFRLASCTDHWTHPLLRSDES